MSTAPAILPPLIDGDRLTRDEFLRRWDAMPALKHAELIDGVVYLSFPVSRDHGFDVFDCHVWLAHYVAATPGCQGGTNSTWLMGLGDDAPQPDLALCVLPEYGGQSREVRKLAAGVPELILEAAYSSKAYDLGPKLKLYERSGVPEYVTWVIPDKRIVWRELFQGKYRELEAGAGGILRSRVFPGLWLDREALLRGDMQRVIAVVQQGIATPEHAEFVRRLEAAKKGLDGRKPGAVSPEPTPSEREEF